MQLNREATSFLATLLDDHYGMPLTALVPVMTTEYRRGTLVNPHSSERVTADVALVCRDASSEVAG
ncbi:hypothetical protein AOC05_09870 [Arthrobacter alpinus]|uniref:Uncharacterized protein n=1 Tax=Arthrobacter alpinus TaxID=656366 RepID=A0A0M4QQ96_9MICC|nr:MULTISPECIES: hypothetical protein [Arthrobacter]ALE92541.1 hypothetical protein AOC05_09870 [Arthrobacter alpinus]